MFDEKNILYIKIWNHPIEATIYKWMFGFPGIYTQLQRFWPHPTKKKRKLDRNVEVFKHISLAMWSRKIWENSCIEAKKIPTRARNK